MEQASVSQRSWSFAQISFVIFMLLLMALFITLGTWQVQRLAEKEAQIATIEARIHEAPVAFPAAGLLTDIDAADLDYGRYLLEGTYDHSGTVLVFTNLPDPVGRYGGVGYWVMTPFNLEDGGIVWVNRGFVPEAMAASFLPGGDAETDASIAVDGIARRPERANTFTPAPDFAARREWVRDPARLTAFLGDLDSPVAPVTLDRVAGPEGELPQGGETYVTFPNRHLEYAGTWYLFAAITPIMLGFWIWRQRQSRNLAPGPKDN